MANDEEWILLNVGGTYFNTTRATLIKASPPNSPLHRISNNSTNVDWDRDDKGAYMIDRDPIYFRFVLNFMRHGRLILHRDIPDEAILLEAEYFYLPELVKLINQRMRSKDLIEQKNILTTLVNNILESDTNQI